MFINNFLKKKSEKWKSKKKKKNKLSKLSFSYCKNKKY